MILNKLAIIIPCYNEEEVLQDTIDIITQKIYSLIQNNKISKNSYCLLIDDGSKDNTWNIIEDNIEKNKFIRGIKLSRNYGHQHALICGLENVVNKCDICISIDADLQDDINIFEQFIDKYNNGYEIVLGVRNDRTTDSFFKKQTAEMYYNILNKIGVKITYNHADFRLMSNKVLIELSKFQEKELFLRGIIHLIGFQTSIVEYKRLKRTKGETKYTFNKMIKLAWTGITSFTSFPLKMVTFMGTIIFIFSILSILWAFISNLIGYTIQGWTSILISVFFLGGLQILSIGIIGEYISKIYSEVKNRPRYIIEKNIIEREGEKDYE